MSIMTDNKYQSDGGPGAVDIVRYMNSNGFPEEDVNTFIKAQVFNYLIGGSDAHAKNYAILEPASGGTLAWLRSTTSHLYLHMTPGVRSGNWR